MNQEMEGAFGMDTNCDCTQTQADQLPIAMAYVPKQKWNGTYELAQALEKGTIFPDLDKPLIVGGVLIHG